MKKIVSLILCLLVCFAGTQSLFSQKYNLNSPDKNLEVEIEVEEHIAFTVSLAGKQIFKGGPLSMKMNNDRVLGYKAQIAEVLTESIEETISVQVPNKDAFISSRFNELILTMKDNYQIIFRVYDDGFAYRFIDDSKQSLRVYEESFTVDFPENTRSWFPQEESLYSHNERSYLVKNVSEIQRNEFCSLPVLFATADAKVLFTEASLQSYPGMFLAKGENNSFYGQFPGFVLKAVPNEKYGPDRNQLITEKANYIAETSGGREYPWRLFIVSEDDRTLVESNLVTQLSGQSKIPDADWIKPGMVAWDWYNANNIYGVDFKAGLNMETYKYYIDFASENDIEYVILDEGWTKSTTEIMQDNEFLDVPELIKYARSKDVDIILWVLWKPLDENTDEILRLYSKWGAAGVKVDFMQRSDQYMVDSYEKIARIAAGYEMLVDYHGAFKPAGLERLWPNIINYEGVKGNENNKWSADINPEHNVTIPFIRMAAGPMDFTPGSMMNMNRKDYVNGGSNFAPLFTRPMSYGTRCHQVAMYVVYEAPLQMLCESPTIYYKEQETVDFITEIPTVWDETVVLEGAVSDYIVVARRKGEDWYVGAMTDWTARSFPLELSFLGDGKYTMKAMKDGINASRNAMDYSIDESRVSKSSRITIDMSSGGGWAAIIRKK